MDANQSIDIEYVKIKPDAALWIDTRVCIVAFTVAVAYGKMLTLLFYRLLASRIRSKSSAFARKINYIIGSILFGLAVFQLLKIVIV